MNCQSEERTLRNSFDHMHFRCRSTKYWGWERYGGKGVTVCERWSGQGGFANFKNDMGPRPPGYTLDRIDNDGPYCKENCRWASRAVQQKNRGEFDSARKLDERGVLGIVDMLVMGAPHTRIAAAFGVSAPMVSRINRGRSWGYLTGASPSNPVVS